MCKSVKTVAGIHPSNAQIKFCCNEMHFRCLYGAVMGRIAATKRKKASVLQHSVLFIVSSCWHYVQFLACLDLFGPCCTHNSVKFIWTKTQTHLFCSVSPLVWYAQVLGCINCTNKEILPESVLVKTNLKTNQHELLKAVTNHSLHKKLRLTALVLNDNDY